MSEIETERENAARVTVLHELRNNYWGNRDTSWEAEVQKLLEKYSQPTAKT